MSRRRTYSAIWKNWTSPINFDTDTAMTNAAARRFYEKTGFVRAGVTRSYVRVEREGAPCA